MFDQITGFRASGGEGIRPDRRVKRAKSKPYGTEQEQQ